MFEAIFLMSAMGMGQCGNDPGMYGLAPSYGYYQPAYSPTNYNSSETQYHPTQDQNGRLVYTTHAIDNPNKTFYAWCSYPVGRRLVPIVADYVPEYAEQIRNGDTVPYYNFSKKIKYSTLSSTALPVPVPIDNKPNLSYEARLVQTEREIQEIKDLLKKDLQEMRTLIKGLPTSPIIKPEQPNVVPDGLKRPSEIETPK